jgi:hypothetical protein
MATTACGSSVCPNCAENVVIWEDTSGGVTVNYWCPNTECRSGKPPWDTPFPPYEFGAWSAIPQGFRLDFQGMREVRTADENGAPVWVPWIGTRP